MERKISVTFNRKFENIENDIFQKIITIYREFYQMQNRNNYINIGIWNSLLHSNTACNPFIMAFSRTNFINYVNFNRETDFEQNYCTWPRKTLLPPIGCSKTLKMVLSSRNMSNKIEFCQRQKRINDKMTILKFAVTSKLC